MERDRGRVARVAGVGTGRGETDLTRTRGAAPRLNPTNAYDERIRRANTTSEYESRPRMKYLALGAIRLYQMTLSPLLPPSCRFEPSCSHYAYTAIERFGLLRGGWMAARRLGRCQPFYHGNLYDPVP